MTRDERPLRPPRPRKPTGELLLAQALDACIRAERTQPGSAAAIIARQPARTRAELRRLVALARSIEASADAVRPSPDFVEGARARLLQRVAVAVPALEAPRLMALRRRPSARGRRRWKLLVRGSVGLIAAVVATTAALSASASSLPGEPLYSVKQAHEELSLRLAVDDEARVLALLQRADARLDETSRLLQQGRTSEAVEVAQRYDQNIARATSDFALTVDRHDDDERHGHLESALDQQQERLETIIQNAPEPARPDLREALATTERGRELVADPRPVERALGARERQQAVAAPPPPTSTPTATSVPPTVVPPTRVPPTATPVVVVAHQDSRSSNEGRGSSDDGDDRGDRDGDDDRDDRPGLARTTQPPATPAAPAVEARPNGNSGRGESTTSNSSNRGESNSGSRTRQLTPPQPTVAVPAITSRLRSSNDEGGSRSSTTTSGSTRPTATPTPRRGSGDARQSLSGSSGSSRDRDDNQSGSSDRGDNHRGRGD